MAEQRVAAELYIQVREWLLYNDLDGTRMYLWAETETGPPADAERCAGEIIWIILCAGRSAQSARTIEKRVFDQLRNGRPVINAFGHRGKAASIEQVWRDREKLFQEFSAFDPADAQGILNWCESIPFVGAITKYQLAKNFGADVCKPDIWLCRLTGIADAARVPAHTRFDRCLDLCRRLSASSGDRVATVDTMLWLACNKGVLRVSAQAGPVSFDPAAAPERRPVLG